MIDLTGTSAELAKFNDSDTWVFLVVVNADSPEDGVTPQYYATGEFDLGANTYEDLLLDVRVDWLELAMRAGLSVVGQVDVAFANAGKLFHLADDFYLENDLVEVYLLRVDSGGNTESDRIPIGRGLIDSYPAEIKEWTIQAVDGSDRDWTRIPARTIDPATQKFAYAPLEELGKPLPVPFGDQTRGPYDDAGTKRFLAPCRCTNAWTQEYTAGVHNQEETTTFQWYPQAGRLGEILTISEDGPYFTITDPGRKMLTRPGRPGGDNTIDDWRLTADGDSSTTIALGSSDTLDVYLGSVPKLGDITDLDILISASGTYTYEIIHAGSTLAGPTQTSTAEESIDLSGSLSLWSEDWDLALLRIKLTAATSATIKEISGDIRFDDSSPIDQQGAFPVFRKVKGFKDDPSKYADGSYIIDVPASPAAALAAGGSLATTTTYYYVVTAVDEGGTESTQSDEVSDTTDGGSNLTIDLSWTAVSWATSYRIYRTTTSGDYSGSALLATVASASYSDDGTASPASGSPPDSNYLTNPVDVWECILRAKDLLGRTTSDINLASFDTARAARTDWKYAFTLLEAVDDPQWIDPFLSEAQLHSWKGPDGKWRCVARDKLAAPTSVFLDEWNVAVVDPDVDYQDQEPSVSVDRVKTRSLVNSYLIHAQRDRTTDKFNELAVATTAWRFTGTCNTDATAGTFETNDVDLTAEDVEADWIIIVEGDKTYQVVGDPVSSTTANITPAEGGIVEDNTGATFWMGVSLDAELVRSRRRYKTLNPLGRQGTSLRDIGGYESQFIGDKATADLAIELWKDFHARLGQMVELETMVGHLDVEPGDVVLFDHPQLPERKQSDAVTLLDGALNDSDLTIPVTSGEEDMLRPDDLILIRDNPREPEVCEIDSVNSGSGSVVVKARGAFNTQAYAHGDGATVERLIRKWEVLAMRPPDPGAMRIGLRLLEMPFIYSQVLVIAPESTPSNWDQMDPLEQALYGAITNAAGLVNDRDPESTVVIAEE